MWFCILNLCTYNTSLSLILSWQKHVSLTWHNEQREKGSHTSWLIVMVQNRNPWFDMVECVRCFFFSKLILRGVNIALCFISRLFSLFLIDGCQSYSMSTGMEHDGGGCTTAPLMDFSVEGTQIAWAWPQLTCFLIFPPFTLSSFFTHLGLNVTKQKSYNSLPLSLS